MKKKVITGIITGLALAIIVFACAFTIINRYVILDNFIEWLGGGFQMENVDRKTRNFDFAIYDADTDMLYCIKEDT